MRVTVTQQDLDNWLHRGTMERELPVQAALKRATGLDCYICVHDVTVIEQDEYKHEPTYTVRRLPHLAQLLNHRCLSLCNPPDLFSPVPYTFEVDLP